LGSEHHLGRRSFLGLLATAAAIGGTGVRELLDPSAASATGVRAKTSDGVVALGRIYLDDHPSEDDADFLVRRLAGIDPGRPIRPQFPDLAPAVAADFEAGRVVSVDGWQLSRTAARAAAAVAKGR
jgi:hypothetical protein